MYLGYTHWIGRMRGGASCSVLNYANNVNDQSYDSLSMQFIVYFLFTAQMRNQTQMIPLFKVKFQYT